MGQTIKSRPPPMQRPACNPLAFYSPLINDTKGQSSYPKTLHRTAPIIGPKGFQQKMAEYPLSGFNAFFLPASILLWRSNKSLLPRAYIKVYQYVAKKDTARLAAARLLTKVNVEAAVADALDAPFARQKYKREISTSLALIALMGCGQEE